VTHANTNLPICSLNIGERTGPVVFCNLWPYVKGRGKYADYKVRVFGSYGKLLPCRVDVQEDFLLGKSRG
ncbi:hypothetical protein K432DRAFT_316003, partial [Lepidopterella palustris CBS 459.81]